MHPADFARGRPRQYALPEEWRELEQRYEALDGAGENTPLKKVYAHAKELKVTGALLEHEYVDRDYRDEYSNFYTKTFRWVPDRCERLHFWASARYVGYCSIRPIKGRPVGRTMLDPGSRWEDQVSCVMLAKAHPYGLDLKVAAFPFVSQDGQYGRCTHAVIWMICHYHHHVNNTPERLMSEIVEAAAHTETERVIPSRGLTDEQVGHAFQRLGLDAIRYQIQARELEGDRASRRGSAQKERGAGTSREGSEEKATLLDKEQVEGVLLRYLNSRMPLALGTPKHMMAVIGAERDTHGRLVAVCCDDGRAPYQRQLLSLRSDGRSAEQGAAEADPWEMLFAPLPRGIFLLGEEMEDHAYRKLEALFKEAGKPASEVIGEAPTRVRTYVTDARKYKSALGDRCLAPAVVGAHRQISTPHWIWVLELQNETLADETTRCVLAEIAIDATSDVEDLTFLFANVPGLRVSWQRGVGEPSLVRESVETFEPYETGTALNL